MQTESFFEKVMLLFPRFYIVKEKFWIPFSGEKEKVREEPTKVIKSSHGTKMKEWTETERILAKQNFFLKFFACKKWVFAVYRHTFTFTKKAYSQFQGSPIQLQSKSWIEESRIMIALNLKVFWHLNIIIREYDNKYRQ